MANLLGGSGRRWQLVAFAIALLLISIGIHGCGQPSSPSEQFEQSNISQSSSVLEFVPRQSLLAAVVDTTVEPSKVWQSSGLPDTISRSINSVLVPLAVDFDQDVRPWLGDDIAFAITDKDLDRSSHNGRQTGYLLVADTSDSERLREFLELFWQRLAIAGTSPRFTEVNGVPIIAGAALQGKYNLATAVVGGHTLLLANDVRVLRQSLRVAQAPTLHLLDHDCCTPGWISLHIPDALDWLGLATPNERRFMANLPWQHLSATTVFQPQGLVINTQLTTVTQEMSAAAPPELAVDLLAHTPQQYLPESMAWTAIGHDLRPIWKGLWQELDRYQRLPSPLQQGQRWQSTQLAQVLAKPLTQLLSDDYAVGQLDDGTWLITVKTTNPTAAGQLDDIARQQGLTVSQLTVKNQAVTAWSRLKTRVDTRNRETTVETDLVALHTKVNDCDLFATSIDGLTAALAAPTNRLSDTQRFQQTVRSMNMPNQGYIYGTWDDVERLLASNRWFSLVKPVLEPWSQSIDAIAITSYGHTVNQSTGTASILLKK
ncbi:DUF3352 domain-containing protein [Leptolyngbya cf. ectocarpi LEGE 11479]|uniref:DUF3352 domain-containing protein n=1 Tax=Leptolyngbya cf. ectocarpi LEGE 11479 TaxID=1828722 RepID=A0A929FAJ8_LEPEC|nr:DUF3352 domain-containing protein [Leptolyngbya ectocarpi]MBE9068452.1 DUF3352 domain-containing protein [Leptolyngbya cf. ectocarpi LEGE 11479]